MQIYKIFYLHCNNQLISKDVNFLQIFSQSVLHKQFGISSKTNLLHYFIT